jgi:uncharacterized protein DUF3551
MRKLAIGLGVLAAMAAPASAGVGGSHPWCMIVQDFDGGWACGFDTFEQCQREARPGNTGFCAQNPAYQPPVRPARQAQARKRRHTR